MADPLKLLFELDAEGEPAVKEFKRVTAAFATELQALKKLVAGFTTDLEGLKKLTASAVKMTVEGSRNGPKPNDGAAQAAITTSKSIVDSQREANRQIEAMWSAREKEQAASLKRQSEAWSKYESGKVVATRQAEKQGEAAVAASQAAKDKAAKASADNFLRIQKQISADVAKANAQTAANQIRAALTAAKGTADISSVASKAIESLSDHLNLFIGHRIPLAGGTFIRLTENVRGFVNLSKESEGSVLRLGNIIADLSSKTGKSAPEIKTFLGSFSKLGTQIEKDEAAVNAFGPALAQKLIPQLAAADAEMTALAASTGQAGGAFAALAGPIGIAVLAVAAVVTAFALLQKKMFDTAEASAKVEGRFVDLNQQIGLSTELLSAFDVLASTTGTDLGSLSSSFGIFQKHLEDAQDPMSESAGLLGELGIQTTDTESALRQTFATLAKMPEGFRQTALALQLFGRGGKSVLAIIKETGGNLDVAIKKFRELGLIVSLEDAKAADKFNDELEILNRQITDLTVELGKEFLPAALDIVRVLSDLTKSSRGLFDLIGFIGKPVINAFAESLRGVSLILAAVRQDTEATKQILKDLEDRRNIAPIEVPGVTPVPLPTGQESALKKAGEEARLVKAEVTEAVRFAESQLAAIDRQLRERELSPAQALEPIIALQKAKTEAVIRGLEQSREEEAKAFVETQKQRNERDKKVQEIDEQIANERAKLDQFEADKRAEFRAQELQKEQEHRRALADIFVNALNDRIAAINRSAQAGINSQLFAQDVTTELLKAQFEKRKQILEQERAEAGKDPALAQQINSQLASLQRERTATLAEQSDRRVEILRDEQRKQLELERSTINSLLRASAITDSSRIATIRSLADLRVKTEEQAAREILKIRLDAIDREKGLALAEREVIDKQIAARLDAFSKQRQKLEGELSKAESISDPKARVTEQTRIAAELQANVDAEIDAQKKANQDRTDADTELNNELRILNAERSQIQADGNRDVDKGRQDDLSNARKYADALKEIHREIAGVLREASRIALDNSGLEGRNRREFIRQRIQLEREAAEAEHKDNLAAIAARREAALKLAKTEEEKLKVEQFFNDLRLAERKRFLEESAELDRQEKEQTDFLTEVKKAFGTPQDFTNFGQDAIISGIKAITAALNEGIQAWLLYGESIGKAMKKALAEHAAKVAAEAFIQGALHAAYAIGNAAFGNFGAAAKHALAAAKFFAIAAVAGFAARGLANSAGLTNRSGSAGTASAAVNGGEPTPKNRTFNGQEPIETASQGVRDGSSGPRGFFQAVAEQINQVRREAAESQTKLMREFGERENQRTRDSAERERVMLAVVERNTQTFSRFGVERHGVVVKKGAADASAEIAGAVVTHSQASGDFNQYLQKIASGQE